MLSKGQQVTGTATFYQNAPCSPCQAKHTQQGGKEQWWGDTHPNTQTTNTKPAHTKNSQKNLPDNHGWDVGLDWDNFRHAETVLGC